MPGLQLWPMNLSPKSSMCGTRGCELVAMKRIPQTKEI